MASEPTIRSPPIKVLGLATLVELKRLSTHPKDLAKLPLLEEALPLLDGG